MREATAEGGLAEVELLSAKLAHTCAQRSRRGCRLGVGGTLTVVVDIEAEGGEAGHQHVDTHVELVPPHEERVCE